MLRAISIFRFLMMLGMLMLVSPCAWLTIASAIIPDSNRRSVPTDEPYDVRIRSVDAAAIAGLSRVESVTAELRLDDGTVIPLEAKSVGDNTWGDSIDTNVMTYKGAQVSDGASKPKVSVAVTMPTGEEYIGRDGDLRIKGRILYPSEGPGSTFIDKTASFNYDRAIRVKGKGSKPTGQDNVLLVTTALFGWGVMLLFGCGLIYIILNTAFGPKPNAQAQPGVQA